MQRQCLQLLAGVDVALRVAVCDNFYKHSLRSLVCWFVVSCFSRIELLHLSQNCTHDGLMNEKKCLIATVALMNMAGSILGFIWL